ncbi:MAG: energy transducer TonB [Flavobacteriaceae bacterium]|nr:MAG: energy transducer TonB [Flavobacteriaceae bacterium]
MTHIRILKVLWRFKIKFMKNTLLLCFTLFFINTFSQNENTNTDVVILTKNDSLSGEKTGDIPFAIIEEAPIFSGCEDIERNKRMDCFQKKMGEHINATFRYPPKARKKNIEGRVLVLFIINKDGEINKIETRGGDPILQTEALRIVRLLPKMKPGMQKGKPVNVKYALPIIFKLN